ncbi:MAG TPA: heme exporter protein CcmD [Arenimonas sp.]
MSYLEYVVGAYAVFAAYLAWDFAVPRWRINRTRRAIALRARRESARQGNKQP